MNPKKLFLLLLICLTTVSTIKAQEYSLVWSDEFDKTISPDWIYDIGDSVDGWYNKELEYYQPDNITVENGIMVISAKKETVANCNYTSGRIKSKLSWKYGKIEARLKVPMVQGMWPAFWMLGEDGGIPGWPKSGEIDIMEHINTENSIVNNIFWENSGTSSSPMTTYGINPGEFHTYSLVWTTDSIIWLMDGTPTHSICITNSINSTEEFHKPFYININLAVGGKWPGFIIDDNNLPAKYYIDYVRVYQQKNETNIKYLKKENAGNFEINSNTLNGCIHIKLRNSLKGNLEVFDLSGKALLKTQIYEGEYKLQNLKKSIYLVRIFNATLHETQKVVVN